MNGKKKYENISVVHSVLILFISLFFQILVTRKLDVEIFGRLALVYSVGTFINFIIEGGITKYLIIDENTDDNMLTYFYMLLTKRASCIFIFLIIFYVVSLYFVDFDYAKFVLVYYSEILLRPYVKIHNVKLLREKNYGFIARMDFVSRFFSSLIGVFLVFQVDLKDGIWVLIFVSLLNTILSTLYLYFSKRKFYVSDAARFDKIKYSDLLNQGIKLKLNEILFSGRSEVIKYSLLSIGGISLLGVHNRYNSFFGLFSKLIDPIIQRLGINFINKNDSGYFHRSFTAICFSGLFFLLLTFFFGSSVMQIVFGEKYVLSSTIIIAWFSSIIFEMLLQLFTLLAIRENTYSRYVLPTLVFIAAIVIVSFYLNVLYYSLFVFFSYVVLIYYIAMFRSPIRLDIIGVVLLIMYIFIVLISF